MTDQGEGPGKLRKTLHTGSERDGSRVQWGWGVAGWVRRGPRCPGNASGPGFVPNSPANTRTTPISLQKNQGPTPVLPSFPSYSFFTTTPSGTSPTCPNTSPDVRAPEIISLPKHTDGYIFQAPKGDLWFDCGRSVRSAIGQDLLHLGHATHSPTPPLSSESSGAQRTSEKEGES